MSDSGVSSAGRHHDLASFNYSSYSPDDLQAMEGLRSLQFFREQIEICAPKQNIPDATTQGKGQVQKALSASSSVPSASSTESIILAHSLLGNASTTNPEFYTVTNPTTLSTTTAFAPINKLAAQTPTFVANEHEDVQAAIIFMQISRNPRNSDLTASNTEAEPEVSTSTSSAPGSDHTNTLSRTPLPTLAAGPVDYQQQSKSKKAKTSSSSSSIASLSSVSGARFGVLPAIYNYSIKSKDNVVRQATADCWKGELIPEANFGKNHRDDEIWTRLLRKLGLTPEEFPAIKVKGMMEQPGTAGKPNGKPPNWNYLTYTLIAISPQGRLKQNTIYNLCLAWCPRIAPNNNTCRHGLCTSLPFYRENDPNGSANGGGWHRLSRLGETVLVGGKKVYVEREREGEHEEKEEVSGSRSSRTVSPGPQIETNRKCKRSNSSRSPKKTKSRISGAEELEDNNALTPEEVEDGEHAPKRIRKMSLMASEGPEVKDNDGPSRPKTQAHQQTLRFRINQPKTSNETSVEADMENDESPEFLNPLSSVLDAQTTSNTTTLAAAYTDRLGSDQLSEENLDYFRAFEQVLDVHIRSGRGRNGGLFGDRHPRELYERVRFELDYAAGEYNRTQQGGLLGIERLAANKAPHPSSRLPNGRTPLPS